MTTQFRVMRAMALSTTLLAPGASIARADSPAGLPTDSPPAKQTASTMLSPTRACAARTSRRPIAINPGHRSTAILPWLTTSTTGASLATCRAAHEPDSCAPAGAQAPAGATPRAS